MLLMTGRLILYASQIYFDSSHRQVTLRESHPVGFELQENIVNKVEIAPYIHSERNFDIAEL